MAKRIAGIALMPRESRNRTFYHMEELRKFDGVTVPLRYNHIQTPEAVIGTATFSFDETKGQVKYEADITNPFYQELVDNKQFQVSIGASVAQHSEMCDSTGRSCLNAPVLSSIDELSIVETPGIPESTLNVLEYTGIPYSGTGTAAGNVFIPTYRKPQLHEKLPCGTIKKDCIMELYINTSDNQNKVKEQTMVEETSKTDSKKVEEAVIATGTITPKEETKPVEIPKHEVAPVTKVVEAKTEIDTKSITDAVKEAAIKEIGDSFKQIRESWVPKSEVAETVQEGFESDYTDEEAKKILEKLQDNGFVNIRINKEDWIARHSAPLNKQNGKVTEAVATSGTVPIVAADTEVVVTKAGKTELSLRPWGKFKALPTGTNTFRFFDITVPDAGAITESPTTDITASTHTLRALDVTCSVRGWRQVIERSQFEDYPSQFLNAIRDTARIEAIRDEHRLIVQELASTARDFAGGTATDTTCFHISGSDGSVVTTTTLEDATGEFDEDGLSFAKRYLQQGNDPTLGPNTLIAFIAPRAFESLYTSSGITQYTMIGQPSVTRLGQLELLYGIDIVVTNELLTANNSYRNLVCIKGKSWALISQREMNIQLQEMIAGQYTNVVWTHRIGVGVPNGRNVVIVSSKQD